MSSGAGEPIAERNERNLNDLLQELRVAGLGVQVLFGFLLSLPFTVRFKELSHSERGLYMSSLLLAALSIALLIAPVAFHRWVFRLHEKDRLLRMGNLLVLIGLGTVALAIGSSILLVMSFIAVGWIISVVVAGSFTTYVILWFVIPLLSRRDALLDRPER
jgi:Family of unknown function (DUF6328)